MLTEYYNEADKVFEQRILQLDKGLQINKAARNTELKNELKKLDAILLKLGDAYTTVMHRSMTLFKDHVSQAHHSVMVDFVFPLPIKGLTF